MGVEVDRQYGSRGPYRTGLLEVRKELAQFDLNKDNMPRPFDPLTDKLPPEVLALFDSAIEFAKAKDKAALLDACHQD